MVSFSVHGFGYNHRFAGNLFMEQKTPSSVNSTIRKPLLSMALPCYNEGELAVENTLKVHDYLKSQPWSFEILVCDDGSSDGTSEKLDALQSDAIRVFHYSNGPSRRENLALTLQQGSGEILAFMDMDLATSLNHLPDLIEPIQGGKFDMVVGSRYQKGAEVERSFLRRLYSELYNRTIRLLLGSRILDHQCGFKAFRKSVLLQLIQEMGYDSAFSRGWFWDAELLIRAQRHEFRILEMPVRWVHARKSSFNFLRELKVIPSMIRLRKELK
jgi:glycosyltransferase involved in cell wall biosynthesis